ncbi:hypothetical protein IEQ34_003629 [Dendrobium chrysotoxum]|uniref:Terpene synthase metal-binding domain-containing protein n=1 Tax=Dendrobium chrysotoxum TaxID=161865 RepID=A0AAV7HI50_DENCH|nr:hypothetical protein IEQ34_003629 [Dendrobium chrysotoxum]
MRINNSQAYIYILWWTKISNLAGGELSFVREWPVESYFLVVEFAKAICFINVVDDIYDIYGSLDELQPFTDAVKRWDSATSKSLPTYMNICLSKLFNIVNSLACKIMEEKGLDILSYLKREIYAKHIWWRQDGITLDIALHLKNI